MSQCRIRLIYWFVLAAVSATGGILVDVSLKTEPFPIWVRLIGLAGMVWAHFPLKRTGKLMKEFGNSEEWGCTTKLITHDIYGCVRHPHHLGVGIFMTSLGLVIGHAGSFLVISLTQWLWILGFLLLVEEVELRDKFGAEYQEYCSQVPMLLPKPNCVYRVLSKPVGTTREEPESIGGDSNPR